MHNLRHTRPLSRIVGGLLLTVTSGCSTPAPIAPKDSTTRAAPRRGIGLQCAMPRGASSGVLAPQKVFVEVAEVDGLGAQPTRLTSMAPPSLSEPSFSAMLDDPRLDIPRFGHVVPALETSATMPWDVARPAAPGRPCGEVERWDLTVMPHVASAGKVRLELVFEPAPPLGTPKAAWHVPAHRVFKMTVDAQDQQMVVVNSPSFNVSTRPSLVVVMPYFLRDDDDMRQLMECKASALGLGRLPPTPLAPLSPQTAPTP
jgi:hypothetical protein